MTNLRLAIAGLCGLVMTAAAQQPLSTPPQLVLVSNRGCSSPPAGETASFDTCLYLPRGNGVKLGRPLSAPDPEYSEFARQHKIKGTVFLAVAINATGGVDAVKVVHSLEPSLDQKAMEAVRQWKFNLATKDGKPVAVQIELTVGFDLY
jgi:TonB family protein